MKNMSKKRIIIFDPYTGGNRFMRFQEEAGKLGVPLRIINPYHSVITNQGVLVGNEKIEFDQNSVVWFVGNTMVNHYLSNYLNNYLNNSNDRPVCTIWPSKKGVLLSDKFYANSFFEVNGIATPKTALLNYSTEEKIDKIVKAIGGFPVVLKKSESSAGRYVGIANSSLEVLYFVNKFFTKDMMMPFRINSYILQEFIEESAGTDFRVLALNGEVLGGIKRSSVDGDFRANVSRGGKAEIIEVDEELKEMALKIARKGNIFYAGIDFIKSDRDYLALEVNTSSQFKGFEAATGINVAGKIIKALLEK